MSGSETLRPTSPNTSLAGMTKPYSDMYTHNHFTDLKQEHSDFLSNLQSFTDPGHNPNSNILERKAWTLQNNAPFHWLARVQAQLRCYMMNKLAQTM